MISEKKPMGRIEAIERLQRRVEWLSKRIDTAREASQRLTFDEAERAALRFAVEHLETCGALTDDLEGLEDEIGVE